MVPRRRALHWSLKRGAVERDCPLHQGWTAQQDFCQEDRGALVKQQSTCFSRQALLSMLSFNEDISMQ